MAAQDMRQFMNGGFQRVNGYGINGNRSLLAVSLAVSVNHFEGSFFNVQCFKRFRPVPSIDCNIGLVFLALSLCKNEPTRLPDKECVMVGCFFPGNFILDGFLSRDRHTKPDCLFSALDEPALAVPVLQRGNRPYWNLSQPALKQGGKLIADRVVMKRGVGGTDCAGLRDCAFE